MIVPGTPQRKVEKQVMNVKIDKVVGPSAELVLFVSLVVPFYQKHMGRRVPAMTKELCASGTT